MKSNRGLGEPRRTAEPTPTSAEERSSGREANIAAGSDLTRNTSTAIYLETATRCVPVVGGAKILLHVRVPDAEVRRRLPVDGPHASPRLSEQVPSRQGALLKHKIGEEVVQDSLSAPSPETTSVYIDPPLQESVGFSSQELAFNLLGRVFCNAAPHLHGERGVERCEI
ncbi:hypothetical protein EYF80_055753 [Liparis tanakae]|uniref:Uncharacterized protein n=1 Tax=Liparis tanakae TaxID=230148 RepID=A0A4Z2EZY8_9TELE|nr:hypothetical protein EYF80_055753 [Liparis tanakae]